MPSALDVSEIKADDFRPTKPAGKPVLAAVRIRAYPAAPAVLTDERSPPEPAYCR